VLPAIDIVAVACAVYLAIAVRFDDLTPPERLVQWAPILAFPLFVRPLINRIFRLYRHSWRYASVPELVHLAVATGLGTALMLVGFLVLYVANSPITQGLPRSFWILEALFSFTAMGALRLAPRVMLDFAKASSHSDRQKAILYGAGEAGAIMARGTTRRSSVGIQPVAFLDDDQRKRGKFHAGVLVHGGLDALEETVEATGADLLLITMPAAGGDAMRRVADAALRLGLQVRTVPSLDEMLNGTFQPEAIRPLRMEDLLRRPPVEPAVLDELANQLRDQLILVTGAAGSIGAELARQLVALGPRELVLVDIAEGPLYELERELAERQTGSHVDAVKVTYRLADVADPMATSRLFKAAKPSVVFHAAAYKHVPVMEAHPSSAVRTNVGGTLAVLDAAAATGVERLVLVSTDKAVDPTSVMGASKRLAELLVAEYSARNMRSWVSVRFGNVLGSSGSVIPIFQKQLDRGEPLTVTHEDMTRFFMTIPEAVHLILQAAVLAKAGDLFVLDMGEPVRIVDLARQFLRLRGGETNRGRIEFTGPRPGEKLHERLFHEHENAEATTHTKVMRVRSAVIPSVSPTETARRLGDMASAGVDERAIRVALLESLQSMGGRPPTDSSWARREVEDQSPRAQPLTSRTDPEPLSR
jgi:FlaA1/EpsC-like NDP-sugar epimerase